MGGGTEAHYPKSISFPLLFFKKKLFIYLQLHWVFVDVHGLSLVGANANYFLVALFRFPVVEASLVMELKLESFRSCGCQALEHAGSVVVLPGLSCSATGGIFLEE